MVISIVFNPLIGFIITFFLMLFFPQEMLTSFTIKRAFLDIFIVVVALFCMKLTIDVCALKDYSKGVTHHDYSSDGKYIFTDLDLGLDESLNIYRSFMLISSNSTKQVLAIKPQPSYYDDRIYHIWQCNQERGCYSFSGDVSKYNDPWFMLPPSVYTQLVTQIAMKLFGFDEFHHEGQEELWH